MATVSLKLNESNPKKARIGRLTSFVLTLPKKNDGSYRLPKGVSEKEAEKIGIKTGVKWSFSLRPNMVFDDSNSEHQIQLKILQSPIFNDIIASRKSDLTSLHRFYFDNPVIEGKDKAGKRKRKFEADKLLFSLNESEQRELLQYTYGYADVNEFTSEMVTSALGEEIDKNPEDFFTKVQNPHRKTVVEINKMVEMDILQRKEGKYYHNQTLIGVDIETAVSFMESPKNVDLVSQLIALLKK